MTWSKESLDVFRAAIEGIADAVFVKDVDGQYRIINAAGARLFGKSAEEIIGRADEMLFASEVADRNKHHDSLVMSSGKTHIHEEVIKFGDVARTFLLTTNPLRDSRGAITGLVIVGRDISDQKLWEERLREAGKELRNSESRFRKVFEQSPISIQILGTNGKTLQVNRAWFELWGVTQEVAASVEAYLYNEYNVLTDPHLAEIGVIPCFEQAFAGEPSITPTVHYDPAVTKKPARARWTQGYIYPIKNDEGQVTEVVLTNIDVTDRVQAENTFKLLAETSLLLATSLDHQATLEKIAQVAIRRIGGWCLIHIPGEDNKIQDSVIAHSEARKTDLARQFIHQLPSGFVKEAGPANVMVLGHSELFPRLLEGPENAAQAQYLATFSALGVKSYMCVSLSGHGQKLGTIPFLSDTRLYHEQDLALAEELASRASLAIENARLYEEAQKSIQLRDDFISIASHELRTPMTPLKMQIQLIKRHMRDESLANFPKREALFKVLEASEQQVDRLARLIEDLLDVSRIKEGRLTLQCEPFDLSKLVGELVERFRFEFERVGCKLETQIEPNVIGNWDRLRIEQAIVNLLTNAIKYGAGKPIVITLKTQAENAILSVQDFGIGIAKEDQMRIFERFERAVPIQRFAGIGLGLYITRQIIEAHGGIVLVESALGKGAVFKLRLPLHNEVAPIHN